MDLWCSVLKVHKFLGLHLRRYLGFKPDMFSGFMTSRFCASKFTDFSSWVCKPTLRTTVGLPQLWPTADLPFAQAIVSSIKFCNTCCRLRKNLETKTKHKNRKYETGEPDARGNPETCFEYIKENLGQPKTKKWNNLIFKNVKQWNQDETCLGKTKTTQKLWTWNPKAIEFWGPEIHEC